MASTPTFNPNPYADFDPSQWSNPYSNFQNSAIPFPASYAGWPTDALGNPIQPQPGMTLNQTPAQQAAAAPAAAPAAGGANPNQALINAIYQGGGQSGGGFGGQGSGTSFGSGVMLESLLNQGGGGYAPAAAVAPAAAAAAPQQQAQPLQVGQSLTPQQYLQLRANPGRVTTPGATVPISQTTSQPTSSGPGGQGVLQQFLANWRPAQSGAGSGFQQGFSTALKGMGY